MTVEGCPREGCVTFQLMTSETRKELEFLADKLGGAVAQATSCLNEINSSHGDLKNTLVEMNTTVVRQSDRLQEGLKRFESMEGKFNELDSKVDCMKQSLAVLKDHDKLNLSKAQVGGLATISSGAVVALTELIRTIFK